MSSCRWFSPHHLSEYSFFFLCRCELVKGRRVKGSARAEAPVMLPVTSCGLSSWIRDTNERICLYVSMSVVQSKSGDVALKPFKKSSITSVFFGCLVCFGCCQQHIESAQVQVWVKDVLNSLTQLIAPSSWYPRGRSSCAWAEQSWADKWVCWRSLADRGGECPWGVVSSSNLLKVV